MTMDRGTVVVSGSRVQLVEEAGGRVARLVLSSPPDNSIDVSMSMELLSALDALERWPRLSCLLVEGSQRDFSAGFNLSHRRMPFLDALLANHHAVCRKMLELKAIRIAVVRGRCLGAGLELALCCHEVLADATARFGLPDATLGAFPTVGGLLLRDRIGQGRADEWILSARTVPADEALAAGLVTAFAAGWDGVDALVERRIQRELSRPVEATRELARVLSLPASDTVARFLPEVERAFRAHVMGSRDHDEGVSAALRGRPPRWSS
jgi:enoyl-CoA hydratase